MWKVSVLVKNTCCFFGHRMINETEELKSNLNEIIEKLIVDENVDTFLFGSKSHFNDLCLDLVTKIKEKYPTLNDTPINKVIMEKYQQILSARYNESQANNKTVHADDSEDNDE